MSSKPHTRRENSEAGVALLIAIFTLMLVSVVAISLIVAAGMESSLSGNYRSATSGYYAAKSGLEEARGRLLPRNPDYFNTTSAAFVPRNGRGPLGLHEVRYVTNPTGGEDVLAIYPDTEYDSEFGGGSLGGATMRTIASISPNAGIPGALYKWVRINPVTEKSLNLDVDGDHVKDPTTLLYFRRLASEPELHRRAGAGGNVAGGVAGRHAEAAAIHRCADAIRFEFSRSGDRARHLRGSDEFRQPNRRVRDQRRGFLSSGQPAICRQRHERHVGRESHHCDGALLEISLVPAAAPGLPLLPPSAIPRAAMQSFPDPLHPGQTLDLTSVGGLNQLVSEVQSIADYTTPDCSDASKLGTASQPTVVVVTGSCSLSGNPSPPGSGILLVQGDVQYVDHPYDGLILAIGTGGFHQSAARPTHFYGSLLLAQTINPLDGLPLGAPGIANARVAFRDRKSQFAVRQLHHRQRHAGDYLQAAVVPRDFAIVV